VPVLSEQEKALYISASTPHQGLFQPRLWSAISTGRLDLTNLQGIYNPLITLPTTLVVLP
jgi:hypothetical protein